MSRPMFALSAVVVALLAAGCGKSSDKGGGKTSTSTASSSTAKSTPTTSTSGPCRPAKAENKGAQHIARPTALLPRNKPATLVLTTNCGEIDIALDVKRAQRTASSVAYLVRKGFYDGLSFHRIAKLPTGGDFVIQGGDPTGTGSGGPGYSVVDKPPPNARYTKGVVAMAKTGAEPAGTAGSQFFVVTAPNAGLPPEYALLGKVTRGLGVVERIGKLGNPANEQPTRRVVIESMTVSP
jgi:peptidyl-prolyl cis-trans isomerase B (cyclophilin B)